MKLLYVRYGTERDAARGGSQTGGPVQVASRTVKSSSHSMIDQGGRKRRASPWPVFGECWVSGWGAKTLTAQVGSRPSWAVTFKVRTSRI